MGTKRRKFPIDRMNLASWRWLLLTAATVSAVLASGFSSLALGSGSDPNPVPDATISNGGFYFPAPGNEPSLITDFNGFVGLSHLTGTVTQTNTGTGVAVDLPFDSDIRFMQGTYVGVDGQTHNGTFLFLWIDVFQPGPGQVPLDGTFNGISNQIHEYHIQIPGSEVIWTVPIPNDSVAVHFGSSASLHLVNFPVTDFHDTLNGLANGSDYPGNGVPATLSLDIHWTTLSRLSDSDDGFRGSYFSGITTTLSWSITQEGFQLTSDAGSTARAVRSPVVDFGPFPNAFVTVGLEKNGVFF